MDIVIALRLAGVCLLLVAIPLLVLGFSVGDIIVVALVGIGLSQLGAE